MDKEKTGNLIRKARVKSGYTQLELGTLLGVSNKTVSKWENGESFPDVGILESLSSTLKIGINDLVVGEISNDGNRQEEITAEVLRIAKLQKKERMKDYVRLTIGGLIILYSIIITYFSVVSTKAIDNMVGIYLVSLAVSLLLVSIEISRIKRNTENASTICKECSGQMMLSIISSLFLIVITNISIYVIEYDEMMVIKEATAYMQIIRALFVTVFIIDTGILVFDLYKYKLKSLKVDVIFSMGGLYLTGLYSFTARNMVDLIYARHMFVIETIVVLIELGIVLTIIKNGKNKTGDTP